MDKNRITLPRLAVPSQSPSTSHPPPPPPPYQPIEPQPQQQSPQQSQQQQQQQQQQPTQPIPRHSLPSLTAPIRPPQPQSSSISKPKKLHREVEQKRRMRMTEQIRELKRCVSDPARGKTDKVSVLQDAVAYIKRASARINQLTEALDRSQAECAHLRALLASFQQHPQPHSQQQQPQLPHPPPPPRAPPSQTPNTPPVSQSWASQSMDPIVSRPNFPVTRQQWDPLPPTPTTPHAIPTQLPHHFPSPTHIHHRKLPLDIRPNPEMPHTSSPLYSQIPVSSEFDRPQLPRPPPRDDDDLTYKSDPSPDPPR